MRKSTISISINGTEGSYFLSFPLADGFAYTRKTYKAHALANKARKREQKKIDKGKTSQIVWIHEYVDCDND